MHHNCFLFIHSLSISISILYALVPENQLIFADYQLYDVFNEEKEEEEKKNVIWKIKLINIVLYCVVLLATQ